MNRMAYCSSLFKNFRYILEGLLQILIKSREKKIPVTVECLFPKNVTTFCGLLKKMDVGLRFVETQT